MNETDFSKEYGELSHFIIDCEQTNNLTFKVKIGAGNDMGFHFSRELSGFMSIKATENTNEYIIRVSDHQRSEPYREALEQLSKKEKVNFSFQNETP